LSFRASTAGAIAMLAFALGAGPAAAASPIIPSTAAEVDYHTEGQIIGGNIQIQTDRAPNKGTALTLCDPDPRPAPNVRPDDCPWGNPTGVGRDLVNFGRHIPDADTTFNGAFTPVLNPDTRENFNGKAGFDTDAPIFVGDFFDDDDMHFRLTPRTLDGYLAPNGDPNNRWRRFCGTGTIEQFNNQGPGGAEAHPPLAPFAPGQIRKFIVEVWDADFRDPSDQDGGNQDYWVIDILSPTSLFDVSTCQTVPIPPPPPPPPDNPPPVNPPPPGPGVNPRPPGVVATTPTPTTGSLPPLVSAEVAAASRGPARVLVSNAGARGPGGCVARTFKVAVRGANIVRVDFALDGKRMSRVTRRDASGMFRATIKLAGLAKRAHHVSARVAFFPGVLPRVRTLPIAFRVCGRAAAAPAFTG
jgi:hypothetical protein